MSDAPHHGRLVACASHRLRSASMKTGRSATAGSSRIGAARVRGDRHPISAFRERCLTPALSGGPIELTLPEKPNGRLQRYRLTDPGRQRLAQHTPAHPRRS